MLVKIVVGLVAILIILTIVIVLQPADFSIFRSAKMSATPEKIFAQVNDFHKWEAWSPWAKLDPNAKNEFDGAAQGEGAIMRWEGNNEVGAGTMTLTKSQPHDLILLRLDFIKPFAGTSTTEFTFKPDGHQTLVTWTMSGKNNFIGKAMSLVMNCDKMVGEQFEKGLASLKSIVETEE